MQDIQAWSYTGSDDCLSGIKGKLVEMSRLKPGIFEYATEGIEKVYKTSLSNQDMSEEYLRDKPLLEARALAQTFSDLYQGLDRFYYLVSKINQGGTSLTIPVGKIPYNDTMSFTVTRCVQFNKGMTTDNLGYTGAGTYTDFLRKVTGVISVNYY